MKLKPTRELRVSAGPNPSFVSVTTSVRFGLTDVNELCKYVHMTDSSFAHIFIALHGMQTQSSDENSVCPSVRLSNACIVTKHKKYV